MGGGKSLVAGPGLQRMLRCRTPSFSIQKCERLSTLSGRTHHTRQNKSEIVTASQQSLCSKYPYSFLSNHCQGFSTSTFLWKDAAAPAKAIEFDQENQSSSTPETLDSALADGYPKAERLSNLPSQQEARRSTISKKISQNLDSLQTTLFTAGKTLNDLTGYTDIQTLRQAIEEQEKLLLQAREGVKAAKEEYTAAIARRSASQREVNELLQRKHAWSANDLERFTELYRSDHTNERAEEEARERLNRAEQLADETQAELGRSILARYHEEQIWSDKIRRASTWGTWALMGVNVVMFLVVQLGLEPWKRQRLVGSFEDRVRDILGNEMVLTKEQLEDIIREASMAGTKAPAVSDALEGREGDKIGATTEQHRRLSIKSAREIFALLWEVFVGNTRWREFSENVVYESTRLQLALWSGVSAVIGASVAGLISIVLL